MHGGAINPADAEFGGHLQTAAEAGMTLLRSGGTALSAVAGAVATAEDDPIFNSGTGSHMNLAGAIEMDASIMNGADLAAGAVACITRVKNPILVAKKVMEETDHVLLVGDGALQFARHMGFADYDPATQQRRQEYADAIARLKRGEPVPGRSEYWKKLQRWVGVTADTVGAVAIDQDGNLAAATSSGGFPLKMPGRVGDVPIIGAGTYADNRKGACSITGQGEVVLKLALAKTTCDLMGDGVPAQQAAEAAVALWNTRFSHYILAIVVIDREGRTGAARNLELTPHVELDGATGKARQNWCPVLKP